MANVAVIGAQWGDEGKGKIVDWLAERADMVVRFQGGHNAGHTLVVGENVYKLSLLPSGIVRGTPSVIGNGVVLDPWALKAEIERLAAQGVVATPRNGRGEVQGSQWAAAGPARRDGGAPPCHGAASFPINASGVQCHNLQRAGEGDRSATACALAPRSTDAPLN